MDLTKVKKQWEDYNEEFGNSDYMDIDTHTSMAMQVGGLIAYIEELEKQMEGAIFTTFSDPIPKKTFKL